MRLPVTALSAAAALVLTQPGCERHSAAETVPGYAEKLAERQAVEKSRAVTPEKVNPDSPRFFPQGQ
jgi:hypothetical protein